jgi:cephalosporin-C deacetylase-like acetyl esterase
MEQAMHTTCLGQRIRLPLLLVILICAWSQATASSLKPKDEGASLFAYDRSVAFDLKEVSAREQDGVRIRDVDYAAYTQGRGRIKAYLVRPAGRGPFAGVLFFHWLGRPNGDRNEFLNEAVALARQGTVSLLIQGYFPWGPDPVDGKTDRQRVIDETIEVRRALDLLLAQPAVDARRIAYVGHDYGAMYGSIVAGVDKRVKTYILMAPIGSFSYWSLAYWLNKKDDPFKATYREALAPVDPITHIPRARPAALLFQFANSDEHIPKAEALAFSGAASKPKEVKWYDAKHDLLVEAARTDRREWLTRQLKLAKVGTSD